MPSEKEMRANQKTMLYQLMAIRKTMSVEDVERFINWAMIPMDEEDIAFVEKRIRDEFKD